LDVKGGGRMKIEVVRRDAEFKKKKSGDYDATRSKMEEDAAMGRLG
jgi:hypothetical protein